MIEENKDSVKPENQYKTPGTVKVGKLLIGGTYPVVVQSMWKKPLTEPTPELIEEISDLFKTGCQILRFAIPDEEAAHLLGKLAAQMDFPLVADIHFDYKLALTCLDYPIAKIRINPGNIGAPWKVEEVVRKAADRGVPIRVGVNSGSLPPKLRQKEDKAAAMLEAAENELNILEKLNFRQVLFSLKSSHVPTTIRANRLFARRHAYPLHLGVTEAGPLIQGVVKSSIAFASLLNEGIGSTIRVSLSDSPENEVLAGKQILKTLQRESEGIDLVSCPTCGRTVFDVKGFLKKVQGALQRTDKNITVAVMGCPVNGPGEAKHADLGITGSGPYVVLFKKGKIIDKIRGDQEALEKFLEELEKF